MSNDNQRLKFGLLENAAHSLDRGFDFLKTSIENEDKLLLKDSIVWIHHGVELTLKHLLAQENEFFVFDQIDKAVERIENKRKSTKESENIGVFELISSGMKINTVGYRKAVERVAIILKIEELRQGSFLRTKLDALNDLRNQIVHYSIDRSTEEVTDMLVHVMHPFLKVLSREIDDPDFVKNIIPSIQEKINGFDYFINQKIKNFEFSEFEFSRRISEWSVFVDKDSSSFENRRIVFKDGFARTERVTNKKL